MKYKRLYADISSKDAYQYAKQYVINHIHEQGILMPPSLHGRSNHQWKKDEFGVVVYDKGNYSYHIDAHKKIRRLEVIIVSTEDEDLENRVKALKLVTNLKEANT